MLNWLYMWSLYGREVDVIGHIWGNDNRDPSEFVAGVQPDIEFLVSGLGDFKRTVVKTGFI